MRLPVRVAEIRDEELVANDGICSRTHQLLGDHRIDDDRSLYHFCVDKYDQTVGRLVHLPDFCFPVLHHAQEKFQAGTAPILYGRDLDKKGHGGGAVDAYHSAEQGLESAIQVAAKSAEPLKEVYSNPLPHVLILTAIVVGVATLSVGLALIVRIREVYGTIEADEVREIDMQVAQAEDDDDVSDRAGSAA